MIQMICGACRVNNALKRAGDGPFSMSPEAEKRLVDAGVAEYAAEIYEETIEAEDSLEIVEGRFTTDSLLTMTRAGMEKLAADLGVDVSKCKNKLEVAELLASIEVTPDDSTKGGIENPPDLDAALPVL